MCDRWLCHKNYNLLGYVLGDLVTGMAVWSGTCVEFWSVGDLVTGLLVIVAGFGMLFLNDNID